MIVEYDSKYADACIDVFMDNFTNPPFSYEWMQRDKIARYFHDMEKTPNFFGFVEIEVEIESQIIVGMCLGAISNYFEYVTYEIKEILISREMQGKGIGSAFLTKVESVLKNSGVDAVTLNTNDDLHAFNFYKKNGYEIAPKAVMLTKLL